MTKEQDQERWVIMMPDNKTLIEAYKEFAEKIIDKRINTAKYGEVVLLTDIYDTLKELGCEG